MALWPWRLGWEYPIFIPGAKWPPGQPSIAKGPYNGIFVSWPLWQNPTTVAVWKGDNGWGELPWVTRNVDPGWYHFVGKARTILFKDISCVCFKLLCPPITVHTILSAEPGTVTSTFCENIIILAMSWPLCPWNLDKASASGEFGSSGFQTSIFGAKEGPLIMRGSCPIICP